MECKDECRAIQMINQLRKEFEDEKEHNAQSRREIYKKIDDLSVESGRNQERYKTIKEDLDELKKQQKEDMRELKQQQQSILDKIDDISKLPGRRWESFIHMIMNVGLGGAITYILTELLNGSAK